MSKSKLKKSEVEKLKLDGEQEVLPRLRSEKKKSVADPFITCSSVTVWNSLMVGSVNMVSGQRACAEWGELFPDAEDYDKNYDNYDDEYMFLI